MTSIFNHKFWRVFVLIIFLFQSVMSDALLTSFSQTPVQTNPFKWASHLGTIFEQSQGSRGPFILHIQEAHSVPQAQKKIAEIIQWFQNQGISQESLSIAVEGAIGPVSTSFLGNFPYTKGREEITRSLIDEGWMTGAEALVISHPELHLRILGVEESQSYLKNFWSFRKAQDAWQKKESQWAELTQTLDQARKNVDSPTLLTWATQFFHFKDGSLSFKDWISFLNQEKFCPQNEQATTLLQTLQQISEIDESAIKKEFKELSEKISKKSSKEDLKNFIELQLRFRLGKIDAPSYYQELDEILDNYENHKIYSSSKVEKTTSSSGQTNSSSRQTRTIKSAISKQPHLEDFPHLKKLINLQQNLSKVEWDKALEILSNEVEANIQNHLIKTQEERSLWNFEKSLRLAQHVFQLKASRKEWEEFKKSLQEPNSVISSEARDLKSASLPHNNNLPKDISQTPWLTKSNLSSTKKENFIKNYQSILSLSLQAQNFYSDAEARDEILFKNIESLIKKEKPKALVIITGGFHTSPLLQKLKEKHFSFCSVTPQVNGTISDELYLKRMMDKTLEPDHFHAIPLASILNPLFDLLSHEAAKALRKNIMEHFVAWARKNNIARETIIAHWPKPNMPSDVDRELLTALSAARDTPTSEFLPKGLTEQDVQELVKLGEPVTSLLEQYLTQTKEKKLLTALKISTLRDNPFMQHILRRRENFSKESGLIERFLAFEHPSVKVIFDKVDQMSDEKILEEINKFLASNLVNNITGPIEEFIKRETVADDDFHQVFMGCVIHLMDAELLDEPEIGKRYLALVEYGYLLLKAVEVLSRTKPDLFETKPPQPEEAAPSTHIRDKDEATCAALTERFFQETGLMKISHSKISCGETVYNPVEGGEFSLHEDKTLDLTKFMRIGPLFFIEEYTYQSLSPSLRKDLGSNVIRLKAAKGDISSLMYGNYTRAVIAMMLQSDFSGKRVIDAGAGTGILSIVAMKLGAAFVDLIDSEKDELIQAHGLLELNGFTGEKDFLLHVQDLQKTDEVLKVLSPCENETAVISHIGTFPGMYSVTNADSIRLASKIPHVTLFIGGGYEAHEGQREEISGASSRDCSLIEQLGFAVNPGISTIHDYGTTITAWAATKKEEDEIKRNKPEINIEEKIQKAREKNKAEKWVGRKNDRVLTTLPKPFERRHVAIGDVHGEQFAIQQNLRDAGLVDENDDWIGGNAVVVQLGDIIDRGAHSYEVDVYLRKLQQQARATGGNLIRILGNHEDMFLRGVWGDPEQYKKWWNSWINRSPSLYNSNFLKAFNKIGYNNFAAFIRSETPPTIREGTSDEVLDRELLKWWNLYRNLMKDIQNGNIQAAYAHQEVLFVHGGVQSTQALATAEKTTDSLNLLMKQRYSTWEEGSATPPTDEHPLLLQAALWDYDAENDPPSFLQVVAHKVGYEIRITKNNRIVKTDIGQSKGFGFGGRRGYVDIQETTVRGIDLAKKGENVLPEGVKGYRGEPETAATGIPTATKMSDSTHPVTQTRTNEILSHLRKEPQKELQPEEFEEIKTSAEAFLRDYHVMEETSVGLEGITLFDEITETSFTGEDHTQVTISLGKDEPFFTLTETKDGKSETKRVVAFRQNGRVYMPRYFYDQAGLPALIQLIIHEMTEEYGQGRIQEIIERMKIPYFTSWLIGFFKIYGVQIELNDTGKITRFDIPKTVDPLHLLAEFFERVKTLESSEDILITTSLLDEKIAELQIAWALRRARKNLPELEKLDVSDWIGDDLWNKLKEMNGGKDPHKICLAGDFGKTASGLKNALQDIPDDEWVAVIIHVQEDNGTIRHRSVVERASLLKGRETRLMTVPTLNSYELVLEWIESSHNLERKIKLNLISIGKNNASPLRGQGLMSETFSKLVNIWRLYKPGVKIHAKTNSDKVKHWFRKYFQGDSEDDYNFSGRIVVSPILQAQRECIEQLKAEGVEITPALLLQIEATTSERELKALTEQILSSEKEHAMTHTPSQGLNIAKATHKFSSREFSPHLQQLLEQLVDLDVPIEFLIMVLDRLSSGDSRLANELITKLAQRKPEVVHALIHLPAEQAAKELMITPDSWRKLQEAA